MWDRTQCHFLTKKVKKTYVNDLSLGEVVEKRCKRKEKKSGLEKNVLIT